MEYIENLKNSLNISKKVKEIGDKIETNQI